MFLPIMLSICFGLEIRKYFFLLHILNLRRVSNFFTCFFFHKCLQWRSQNAENVAHVKWRLLDQAVSLRLRPFTKRVCLILF